jgi:hypothetical protein
VDSKPFDRIDRDISEQSSATLEIEQWLNLVINDLNAVITIKCQGLILRDVRFVLCSLVWLEEQPTCRDALSVS